MKPVEISTEDLRTDCEQMIKTAKVHQMKWIYAYLKDLEEFPIVSDIEKKVFIDC
jgi:hypothetical protein